MSELEELENDLYLQSSALKLKHFCLLFGFVIVMGKLSLCNAFFKLII